MLKIMQQWCAHAIRCTSTWIIKTDLLFCCKKNDFVSDLTSTLRVASLVVDLDVFGLLLLLYTERWAAGAWGAPSADRPYPGRRRPQHVPVLPLRDCSILLRWEPAFSPASDKASAGEFIGCCMLWFGVKGQKHSVDRFFGKCYQFYKKFWTSLNLTNNTSMINNVCHDLCFTEVCAVTYQCN